MSYNPKIKLKTILKSFFVLTIFAIGIETLAFWMPPTLSAPNGNTESPVNVGDILQFKNGNFVAQGLKATVAGIFEGSLQIVPGAGAGKVLTSDATGLASWANPTSGDSLWIRNGNLLSPLNPDDDIGISSSSVIYKNGERFIHTYGTGNTFMGLNSGNFSTTGSHNTGFGVNTLQSLGSGAGGVPADNTAIGYASLFKNTTAGENTAIGVNALYNNIANSPNGGGNTSVGYFSSFGNTAGNLNTAVGFSALSSNTTGDDNIGIGRNANVSSGDLNNAIAIGASTTVNASNKVRIGNTLISVIEGQVDWSFPSDIRIKKNIKDSDLGLDFINKLRPVSFQRINGDDLINYGFIAQEVEKVLNGENTSIVLTDSTPEAMKTMRYTQLIAPMVKGMQELKAENDFLKKENNDLKERMEAVELKLNKL